jgi:hypothetical protein
MIDTSVVRVHQHGACIAGNREQHMGRDQQDPCGRRRQWPAGTPWPHAR